MDLKPFELSYYIDDVTHALQSAYVEIRPLGVELKSGEAFEFNLQRDAENLTEDFEIRDGFVIPAGRYWSDRLELQFESFEGRPLVAAAGINWGEFYTGSSAEYEAQLAWKPSRHFSASADYARTDIRLAAGAFSIDEVVGRLNLSLTPRLYGSVFGQWNNDDDEILFNVRITWIPKPGAYLYVVFNQFGDTLDPRRWRMNTTVTMVKFVWYFGTK